MILAARYARENKIPYLGLCLGMQVSIIEFARHVCGFNDAHSIELDPNTTHPVIALMPDQDGVEDIGGTLRLGAYPCVLDKDSKAYEVYGTTEISERHRHRYEVNNDYRATLTDHGMKLCGTSPDGRIVEMIELPDHPWFIASGFSAGFSLYLKEENCHAQICESKTKAVIPSGLSASEHG